MPAPELNWIPVEVPVTRDSALHMLAAGAALDAPLLRLELPDLRGFPKPIDKARLLLQTAAEIEHALLVQYLYGAYSLKSRSELTDPAQQQAVDDWRRKLVGIAKEEMGHLMTVQNLLLIVRQALNFEREDFPPRKRLYPFPMHLEPLAQASLAKYVVAESPVDAPGIDDIVRKAGAAAGQAVNHVGVLYGLLGVVFSTRTGVIQNAPRDSWSRMVKELADLVYAQQGPPSKWHLPGNAFDPASAVRQASDSVWGLGDTTSVGKAIRVLRVASRTECLRALCDIGLQGEGPTGDALDSHFRRFLNIYRGADGILPMPDENGWRPSRDVPINPRVVTDPAAAGPQDISNPAAVAWATLANQRYGLLLGLLEQYFLENVNDREWIRDWCFSAMRHLARLADKLTTLDRATAGQAGKAAIPFTLPPELQLPGTTDERRRLHLARLDASVAQANAILASQPGDPLATAIKNADEQLRTRFGGTGPVQPTDPVADMRALLQQKQSEAENYHFGVSVGSTTLNQLFADNQFDDILAFLRTGMSHVSPFENRPLVAPGRPMESAYYLHISQPGGAMDGVFTTEEIAVVERWINSLVTSPGTGPNPTPPPQPLPPQPPPPAADPKEEMLALLRRRRSIAQAMHSAIAAGAGSLSDLFRQEKYDDVLQFLQTARATLQPFANTPLIVPKNPAASAFYRHLTDPAGVMAGRLTPDELRVVENWINSLTPPSSPPVAPSGTTTVAAKRLATGLSKPLGIAAPPGDTQRLFVVEQTGAIKIVDVATGQVRPQPFLTVSGLSTGGERGLLGLAFHPQYATNGFFFVNGTNAQGHTEIRRYKVSSGNRDLADPNSQLLVLRVDQPFANHNGGWLGFGPRDGFLYVALGDGGSANDPQNRAQNLNVLLGKMLRLDVDRDDFPNDPNRNYGVPASNPFVGRTDARPEIWAYGLRNPWRCCFDRTTGDLYLGDVGQNQREEVDFQPGSSTGGENYGWNLREGTRDTGLGNPAGLTLVDPIHEYGRAVGTVVIGGCVYRGAASPALAGTYFFGDFTGKVWSFRREGGTNRDFTERTAELSAGGASLASLSSFGEDARGELYFTTLSGELFRLDATTVTVTADRWRDVARVRIHPAIGVARIGNAGFVNGVPATPADPADFFVGPERPFETAPPTGGYKRNGRVRRQAARFRLFAYDQQDKLIGEVTSDVADIAWTVELANKKASFNMFDGPNPNSSPRNVHVTSAADRAKLEIKPGPRTLTGPNQSAAFGNGTFTDLNGTQAKTVSNIYLGGVQTEADGRLLVLAGQGKSESPWNRPLVDFANNDGWYDDVADGPVNATVRMRGTNAQFQAAGAWVVCAPPKFAPAIRNIVTMYDTLRQVAVDKGLLPAPGRPSFTRDIQPILQRAIDVKWIMPAPPSRHSSVQGSFPPATQAQRQDVFRRLRHPRKGQNLNGPGMNMPRLSDDNARWSPQGDAGVAVTRLMYDQLTKWRDGDFDADWNGQPAQPPAEITPEGLDQAALEHWAGAAFFPGIEASWMVRDTFQYLEPFRLDPTSLRAGDISRQMAVPWQADFFDCRSGTSGIGWWPQQRPDRVYPDGSTTQAEWTRNKVGSHADMVARWHELGFVVWNGTRYVETDRNPDT